MAFNYNTFYNSWTTGIGANDINEDPQFVDSANGDFTPQNAALIVAPKLFGVEYDYNEEEREDTTTIGAIKHDNE